MTESTTPEEYGAGSDYECKSKHIVGLSPCILLEPHSFLMGKTNHTQNLHFLARPIIGLNAQTFIEKLSTILGYLQQPQKCLRSKQEKVIHSDPDP